jgi:hypothetical protein
MTWLVDVAKTHKATKGGKPAPRKSHSNAGDLRWWAIGVVSGLGAYLTASHGLFFTGGTWQIPLFVGCVVGLATATRVQAATVAGSVTLASLMLLPPLLPFGAKLTASDLTLALALSAAAAAIVAHLHVTVSDSGRRVFTFAASAALVLWVIINMWMPLFATGLPVQGYGILRAAAVNDVPAPDTYQYDDQVYRRTYYLLHQDRPYYEAFNEAWLQQQNKPAAPNSVMGYRLPTYYALWRLLPSEVFSLVYLFLAFCTVGVIASASIAGQLVGARFAPLAACAMAAYSMSVGITASVTYIDLPSMCIALAGIALLIRAKLTESRKALWAAIAVLTLAALTREILAYFLVLGALTALLEVPEKRLKAAAPWGAGLGVFFLGYAMHAAAVWGYLSDSSKISYLRGNLDFAIKAITTYSFAMNGQGVAISLIFALGVAGAVASHRRLGRTLAWMFTVALVLPILAMVRFGNIAIAPDGTQVNYWGMLVVPLALALWPSWVLLLKRTRST